MSKLLLDKCRIFWQHFPLEIVPKIGIKEMWKHNPPTVPMLLSPKTVLDCKAAGNTSSGLSNRLWFVLLGRFQQSVVVINQFTSVMLHPFPHYFHHCILSNECFLSWAVTSALRIAKVIKPCHQMSPKWHWLPHERTVGVEQKFLGLFLSVCWMFYIDVFVFGNLYR